MMTWIWWLDWEFVINVKNHKLLLFMALTDLVVSAQVLV